MIENTLREGLACGLTTKLGVEAKGLRDREVSLNGEHGCSWPLFFAHDLSTTLVKYTIDTANRIFRALYLDCVNELLDRTSFEERMIYQGR